MTPLFHGYPVHPDAVPDRPWWRRNLPGSGFASSSIFDPMLPMDEGEGGRWRAFVRTDGVAVVGGPGDDAVLGRHGRSNVHVVGDGETVGEALARVDRGHPLPAPPPLVGQVWVWSETDEAAQLPAVVKGRAAWGLMMPRACVAHAQQHAHERAVDARRRARMATRAGDLIAGTAYLLAEDPTEDDYLWPPPGAVLVAGPHSPWSPS